VQTASLGGSLSEEAPRLAVLQQQPARPDGPLFSLPLSPLWRGLSCGASTVRLLHAAAVRTLHARGVAPRRACQPSGPHARRPNAVPLLPATACCAAGVCSTGSDARPCVAVPTHSTCLLARHSFSLFPAVEALLGLLFANLFWVGLWDLLDTTIFPFDSSYAMLLLVCVLRSADPCVMPAWRLSSSLSLASPRAGGAGHNGHVLHKRVVPAGA
jgi:hypothetical protein